MTKDLAKQIAATFITLTFCVQGCAESEKTNLENPKVSKTSTVDVTQSITQGDVKSLMYTVLSEISTLQPFMVNEAKFNDPKNEKEIASHLDQLTKLSAKVMKTKKLQAPGYRLSGEALDSHFNEMKYAFSSGNKKYARWMLSSTPFACASCHTQLANSPRPLWELKEADLSGTPFERADFLFATRNYDQSEKIFTELIRNYPGPALNNSSLDTNQIDVALKRKLSIYVRIRRDFKGAQESFTKDLDNKKLTKDQSQTIASWINQLDKLKKQDSKLASKPIKVIAYASQVLEGTPRGLPSANFPKAVEILNVSSLLYTSLHDHPRDLLTPTFLFWLGVADLSLNNEFFFSLGSTYFKECMRQYPKEIIARRCYSEYEADVKNLYTGTRGTDIPEDAIQELKYFKNLVGMGD